MHRNMKQSVHWNSALISIKYTKNDQAMWNVNVCRAFLLPLQIVLFCARHSFWRFCSVKCVRKKFALLMNCNVSTSAVSILSQHIVPQIKCKTWKQRVCRNFYVLKKCDNSSWEKSLWTHRVEQCESFFCCLNKILISWENNVLVDSVERQNNKQKRES